MKGEIFLDNSYYHLWAVRPVGDKDFSSTRLFHFVNEVDAINFKVAAEKSYL